MSNISFFHPHFLWAMLFLAVPILIHFLNKKRTILLEFSSIRFLQKDAIKASSIKGIKNLLLLICRLLIVASVVLLFSQLFNKKDPFTILSSSNSSLYCWIDPTMSMSYRHEKNSLWQEASTLISRCDSTLSPGAKLYCYSDQSAIFSPIDRNTAKESTIQKLSPLRFGHSNFQKMIQTLESKVKKEQRQPVLLLFSDFQAHDSLTYTTYFNLPTLPLPTICVSLRDKKAWNFLISKSNDALSSSSQIYSHLRTFGKRLNTTNLITFIGSRRAGQESLSLNKNDTLTTVSDITHYGNMEWGEIRLAVEDPLSFDNKFFFIGKDRSTKRVLVIAEGNEAFPVLTANNIITTQLKTKPLVKHPTEVTFEDLDTSEILLFLSLPEPTTTLSLLWTSKAFQNKVVLFSPYMGTTQGSLNDLILSQYLGSSSKINTKTTDNALNIVLPDTVSSLWRQFPRFVDRDVLIYSFLSNLPGTPMLLLSNGEPLISEQIDQNQNTWILFASPIIITEANNICETGFFIPLLDRIVQLALSKIGSPSTNWLAGFQKNNPYFNKQETAQVYDSKDKLITTWSNQRRVSLPIPGIYKIIPEHKQSYWLAVNPDPIEGETRYFKPKASQPNSSLMKVLDRNSFDQFMNRYSSPDFDYLWILLGVLLLIEIFLWKRPKKVKISP